MCAKARRDETSFVNLTLRTTSPESGPLANARHFLVRARLAVVTRARFALRASSSVTRRPLEPSTSPVRAISRKRKYGDTQTDDEAADTDTSETPWKQHRQDKRKRYDRILEGLEEYKETNKLEGLVSAAFVLKEWLLMN